MKKYIVALTLLFTFFSCSRKQEQRVYLLQKSAFEKEVDGKPVSLYTLDSGNGLVVQVTNYGLRVVSVWTPDKNGTYADVAVGYETLDRYLHNEGERFLGPVVGRYANRIARGKFTLDGREYVLPVNNNGQTLHGGQKGLDRQVWTVDEVSHAAAAFSYVSPDGEDGFPGTLRIRVLYSVTPENEFVIRYEAATDQPTVINLSNHAFFNLKGEAGGTITDHLLAIDADSITPVDSVLIPTGEIVPVENTPFDFRTPSAIGARINVENDQLKNGGGYDLNWVLNKPSGGVRKVASLYEPVSGRLLEVFTDQPGLQFYSGNFFDGKVNGKYGKPIGFREALALETQRFPDSPNRPGFPSTRLNPGEVYSHTCIYRFGVKR